MSQKGTLKITFPSPAEARTSQAALEPDNAGHLRSRVEGAVLVLEAEADSMMGLLRTLDDALGCLRATGMP